MVGGAGQVRATSFSTAGGAETGLEVRNGVARLTGARGQGRSKRPGERLMATRRCTWSGRGQARWVSDADVRKQNQFIDQLFDLAAW